MFIAAGVVLAGSYVVSALRSPSATPIYADAGSRAVQPGPIAISGDTTGIDAGASPAGSLGQIDHSIATWSKNLAANAHDFISATNLAVLYHGRGRLSYDLTDHERALEAARTALDIEPSYAPARAIEASILFTLHDFSAAYATADALVRADPTQVGALATRFDAALELGRIADAEADLERFALVGGPAVLIRAARLDAVTGDGAGALATARRARAAAIDDEADDIGFYAYAVGEYARLAGDSQGARAAYREALDARSDDVAALIGLARVDAFDGDPAAAIEGLERTVAIAPQPEALALLGDLQSAAGDPAATRSFETVRFIERLDDLQATTFDRQLLRFELDHGGASDDVLTRARASLAGRPDWTGHDTVAWALYRLGRFNEAAIEIAAARALGADDARLRYHEGAILVARGSRAAGRDMLSSAMALGPALDPVERSEAARILAR